MRDINSDILHTHLVMNGRRFPNYNRVYYHSNENLKEIFSHIDVNDKDVLSVLGSGDQMFHFYNNGAKSVEVFDVNRLTYYYYYIRMWTMKYLKKYYPEYNFNINFIKNLLCHVKIRDEDEKDAFNYWCKYIELFNDKMSNKLFYRGIFEDVNKLDDFSRIREKLNNQFVFYDVNLGDKNLPIRKKFDLVYISNISDYIPHNINSFIVYRDNIERLLKDGGKILSVNLRKLGFGEKDLEKELFSEIFNFEELPEIERYDFKLPGGKIYTKK